MKNKANNKLEYCYLIFILIGLIGCRGNVVQNEECSKFIDEKYIEGNVDTALIRASFNCQKILLERFDESSVKGLNYEAYHLQYYSSHGFGRSVKFEKKIGGALITVKCKTKEDLPPDCKEYQIGIDEEEWNELEKMIYEFDFWTAEDFRVNMDVLDGDIYFLEGNRPEAKKCNKKTYKLVGRGSPSYDKIEALCNYIFDYEDQLKFKYEQMNKIK